MSRGRAAVYTPRPSLTGGAAAGEPTQVITLHRGHFGFGNFVITAIPVMTPYTWACFVPAGVNVSDVAVVLDVRANAKDVGVRKGHIISSINGTAIGFLLLYKCYSTKSALRTTCQSQGRCNGCSEGFW